MKLGQEIRKLRLTTKKSQAELAKLLQITPAYLSKIENCYAIPHIRVIQDIAHIFNIVNENKDHLINLAIEDKQEQAKAAYLRG